MKPNIRKNITTNFQQVELVKTMILSFQNRPTFTGIEQRLLIRVKFQKKLFIVLEIDELTCRTSVSKTTETFRFVL